MASIKKFESCFHVLRDVIQAMHNSSRLSGHDCRPPHLVVATDGLWTHDAGLHESEGVCR